MTDTHSAALVTILKQGRARQYPKGQLIQSTDFAQSICLVKSGYVKRYMITADGSKSTQSIYGPKAFFPFSLVYDLLFDYQVYQGSETFYYEAMSNCVVYVLNAEELKQAVATNHQLYKDLLFVAGRRFKWNVHRIENASMHDAYHRVAHQLVFLAKNFGTPDVAGVRINIPMTHQDIADSVNVSRETASLVIARLRSSGLIKTNKRIRVLDIKKLEDEAYG